MKSRVEVILNKLQDQLEGIRAQYSRDLSAKALSDDLMHDISRFVEDCQRALDWTATDLDHTFGRAAERSPYFPLRRDQQSFESVMSRDFPGLPAAVYRAVERHQPFQSGHTVLGVLHDLARVSKHQDFVPQTRTETRRVRAEVPGGGAVEWTPYEPGRGGVVFGPGVFINGVPVDPRTQRPVPAPTQIVTETIYVAWRFRALDLPVLETLESLARLVPQTVADIRSAATT